MLKNWLNDPEKEHPHEARNGGDGDINMMLVMPEYPAAAALGSFDTSARVGAALNSDGNAWLCVVLDSTHIQCGRTTGGSSVSWCTSRQLPTNYQTAAATGAASGIYLVQSFPAGGNQESVAFMTIGPTATSSVYYHVIRFVLSDNDLGNHPDCVYDEYKEPAPYVYGGSLHPDLSPRLALANGTGGDVWVFSVVPTSDPYSAGRVVGFSAGGNGTAGGWSWPYSAPQRGLIDGHTFDSDPMAPVTAVSSSLLSGEPLLALREDDGGVKKLAVIYELAAGWSYSITSLANGNEMGNNVALANVPVLGQGGQTLKGDSVLVVDDAGEIQEAKFTCTNNNGACNGGHALGMPQSHGDNGAAIDFATDSLAASWYQSGGDTWVVPYDHVDDSTADTAKTDIVTPNNTSWNDLLPGASGWSATDQFFGQQVVVRDVANSKDLVFGACTTNQTNSVCRMTRTWGANSFAWLHHN